MKPGPLNDYIADINDMPRLSPSEERAVAIRNREGDHEARDLLISANLKLVVKVSKRYENRGVSKEDLVSEGNLGLIRAVESFDPSFKVNFSTYASYWIKQSIRKAVRYQGKPIAVTASTIADLLAWRSIAAKLKAESGFDQSSEEVDKAMGISALASSRLRAARVAQRQIYHEINNDIDAPHQQLSAEDNLERADELERLTEQLAKLDSESSQILRMRFGLSNFEPMGYVAIAKMIGKSRNEASQIGKDAMKFLAIPKSTMDLAV